MSAEPSPAIVGESVLVAETGLGRLQMEARSTSSAFLVDEPVSAGGLGSGPTPYDLLSAALGACTAMTLRLYADRKGWPLEHVEVGVVHHRASLKDRDLFERTISLKGPLDEAQKARLLQIADGCPVHRTFDRGADVTTTLSPASVDPEPSTTGQPSEHMRDMDQAVSA
jgi:putative redox protein